MFKSRQRSQSPNGTALIPDILLIEFQAVSATEFTELFLEGHSLVMFLLVSNVRLDVFNHRRADREGAVTGLPGKGVGNGALTFHPFARFNFAILDNFHHRESSPRAGYPGLRQRSQDSHALPWASIGSSLRDCLRPRASHVER